MIAIVDYGLGNVTAFATMYKRLGIDARLAARKLDLQGASHIVLPGVGSFDHAMQSLEESGMREPLSEMALERGVPVLGVCVGMQMLGKASDEGKSAGLGWLDAQVRAFVGDPRAASLPLPHMGWNDVRPTSDEGVFRGMQGDARFYFLHSFYVECADEADVSGMTDYGFSFAAAVRRGNILGVQFHPEKSHRWGATVLKNFAEI